MWVELLGTVVVLLLLLYVPGTLLLRGLGLSRVVALCCAPCVSIGAYAVLPIAYGMLGVRCSALAVGLPVLLLGALVWVVGRTCAKGSGVLDVSPQGPVCLRGRAVSFDVLVPACYVVVAMAVCCLVFVGNLSGPESFACDYDNQTHLNAVRAFLDSGMWSTLHVGPYLAVPSGMAPVLSATGSLYPAGWHDVVTLACAITGVSVPLATNAMIVAMCGVAYPLSAYLFLRALLANNRTAVTTGAVLPAACAAVPWIFVGLGPTLPDMAGRVLVLAPLGAVVLFVRDADLHARWQRLVAFVLCAGAGLVLLHPNTFFSAYVFLAAFGAHEMWHRFGGARRARWLVGYCVLVVVGWVMVHELPFMRSTLRYYFPEQRGLVAVLRTIVTFGLDFGCAQPVLMLLAVAGIVAVVRRRELWLLFAPAYFCVCLIAIGVGCQSVSFWLAGPWYQASVRFPINIYIFALPCLALGLGALVLAVRRWVESHGLRPMLGRVATGGLVAVLCIANFLPVSMRDAQTGKGYESSFARVGRKMYGVVGDERRRMYDAGERAFVERVVRELPEGAYVYNAPNDGSMWAYAANELRVCFRNRQTHGQTDDAVLVRRHLSEYATNQAVREAVARMGIKYVLLLDKGVSYEDGVWLSQYHKGQVAEWEGITSIDDTTPGFGVVLSEGDEMRLYRIG